MSGQATITIRDKQWTVNIANTPWELAQGLGGLASMPVGTGTLFDLGVPQVIQVTTVPMLFPLDIAFLSDTLVVTEAYRHIEPGYLVPSTLPARYFLEVNAGELDGIDSGDRASVEITSAAMSLALPDWVSAFLSLMGLAVAGILTISLLRDLVRGLLEEPKEKPALLPQTEAKFKAGDIVLYRGERVRVSEQIGDRVNIFIPSRQELVWVKSDKLEKIEPASPRDKRIVLSSLILEELTAAGLGYVARDVSRAVEERCQFSDWVELWDGTTFERREPYRGKGVTIPRLVVAEIGIRTGLTYNECVAVAERIDSRLKQADLIVLDDGTVFKKSFVPVKRASSTVAGKSKENLASEILKGLSSRDSYRAYVRHPKDKSAFVTIGAIIGGHYSWNPAGFTVWVDAWERNPEWPPDHILAIKELRRPHTFEATEEGVRKALEYIETEFPSFTETVWVSKSIPLYVAHELGIMKKEAAPEWLPGVVVMPRIPDEARKDVLFVQYIHDLVRLGERINDEDVRLMWEAWKKRELSRLPHTELIKQPKHPTRPAVIPKEKRPRRDGELEFLPDSPEFLAYTIDDIGYREKIDSAFQQAIARAKRSEQWQ